MIKKKESDTPFFFFKKSFIFKESRPQFVRELQAIDFSGKKPTLLNGNQTTKKEKERQQTMCCIIGQRDEGGGCGTTPYLSLLQSGSSLCSSLDQKLQEKEPDEEHQYAENSCYSLNGYGQGLWMTIGGHCL